MTLIIKCTNCQENFNFTDSEQEFYKNKNYQSPKICIPCRIIRKRDVEAYTYTCSRCNDTHILNGLEKDKLKGFPFVCEKCK